MSKFYDLQNQLDQSVAEAKASWRELYNVAFELAQSFQDYLEVPDSRHVNVDGVLLPLVVIGRMKNGRFELFIEDEGRLRIGEPLIFDVLLHLETNFDNSPKLFVHYGFELHRSSAELILKSMSTDKKFAVRDNNFFDIHEHMFDYASQEIESRSGRF